ncbi:MAG: nucleotide exchange factor GrpE [Verrucomicrobia bacterium]|jgi:molecular chaperone GrpE (heat shock protein)|nr:nucleotide exchange factor GrpE [Verrucomicrobiota bacterium]
MSLITIPRTAKWPFFIGDALLTGLAWFLYTQARLPMNGPTLTACVACVILGALLGITPFIMDYKAEVRLLESSGLATTVEQIRGLETIAAAVNNATSQWQGVHEHATQTVNAARQVSEKMSQEMKSFIDFLEKANDSERQHLRLELDKLKRAEADWLGVLVRILDHVFAIHSAARRAGQDKVLEQLTQLQLACRDAARRVGLNPFEAEPGAPFDPNQHQVQTDGEVPDGARVAETLGTGFTFRGQKIRPAIVSLEPPG